METDATPTHRRDALIASVALLLLGSLWLLLRLYWQGALIALVAVGVGALARRRPAEAPAAPEVATAGPEEGPRRAGGGKGKGRKKRR